MRLTTKGRYGMRLVLDIAQNENKGPVSMAETALRQNISAKYLERLVGELQRAGLIKGLRGREGGHLLALPPEKITVGDVVRTLEGDASGLACSHSASACPRAGRCLTRAIWIAADQAMFERLDAVTVRDLLNDGQNCLSPQAPCTAALSADGEGGLQDEDEDFSGPDQAEPTRSAAGSGRTLIVDDDRQERERLRELLRERGFAADGAATGAEALKDMARALPDLIILKLEMDGGQGLDFYERSDGVSGARSVPLILISDLPDIHRVVGRAVGTIRPPVAADATLRAVEAALKKT